MRAGRTVSSSHPCSWTFPLASEIARVVLSFHFLVDLPGETCKSRRLYGWVKRRPAADHFISRMAGPSNRWSSRLCFHKLMSTVSLLGIISSLTDLTHPHPSRKASIGQSESPSAPPRPHLRPSGRSIRLSRSDTSRTQRCWVRLDSIRSRRLSRGCPLSIGKRLALCRGRRGWKPP